MTQNVASIFWPANLNTFGKWFSDLICSEYYLAAQLTHWGRVTHLCVSKLSIIGSDNGLSPDRRQAIIWTNAGILLIGTLGTNFIEISIGIQTFLFKKMHLKMSSGKWLPFCLGLNVSQKMPYRLHNREQLHELRTGRGLKHKSITLTTYSKLNSADGVFIKRLPLSFDQSQNLP